MMDIMEVVRNMLGWATPPPEPVCNYAVRGKVPSASHPHSADIICDGVLVGSLRYARRTQELYAVACGEDPEIQSRLDAWVTAVNEQIDQKAQQRAEARRLRAQGEMDTRVAKAREVLGIKKSS